MTTTAAPATQKKACCGGGPGYATPLDAYRNGPRERLVYVPCIAPAGSGRRDYLATVDVDPESAEYGSVIARTAAEVGDELHHTGWNACASCWDDSTKARKYLVMPALKSGNIHIVDTSEARAPKLHKTVRGEDIRAATGLTHPHTTHCLADGHIMVSHMGTGDDGEGACGFLLLDGNFDIVGRWNADAEATAKYGYDFWYQPFHNVMVSTGWGAPRAFTKGFDPADVARGEYGQSLYFWDWKRREIVQTADLGAGTIPLEVRFLHNPREAHGYVGAALESSVYHFHKDEATGEWATKKVIQVDAEEVEGWALPNMPGLITDILVSMDDRYLYLSNWLQGDIRQYDITDRHAPRLTGQVFVGGSLRVGGGVTRKSGASAVEVPTVKGVRLEGAPQMIQLSLDGSRLYVTNSLFTPWDDQFYPDMGKRGSQMYIIDVDQERGGLSLRDDFVVDFGAEPEGPVLAHEVRYPGGDCSSDIYLADFDTAAGQKAG